MNRGEANWFRKLLSTALFWLVRFVKQLFQMQDGTCRFQPTCSEYSRQALLVLPLYKAIPKIFNRVRRCHPRGDFGYDPVISDPVKEHSGE